MLSHGERQAALCRPKTSDGGRRFISAPLGQYLTFKCLLKKDSLLLLLLLGCCSAAQQETQKRTRGFCWVGGVSQVER